jgi:DNA-directed RNA polymerase subunit RPC12/RpoP
VANDAPPFVNPDEEEESRSAFQSLAESKGWKCRMCTNTILLEDRETYLRVELCSRCAHKMEE